MPRIFLPDDFADLPSPGGRIAVRGDDAFHLANVLRVRVGEKITLCTIKGVEYLSAIVSVSSFKKSPEVICEVLSVSESEQEPPQSIRVFQGLPKGKKTDVILQKCTELGASEITFVTLDHSVPEGDPEKKVRFEKICRSAAEQCGRGKPVKVSFLSGVKEAIEEMKKSDVAFACYEAEKEGSLPALLQKPSDSISFLIGPEGGLSDREVGALKKEGIPSVTLGKRILRTETAAGAVLAMILYEKELKN